jgi:D-lactate dehydrogenase
MILATIHDTWPIPKKEKKLWVSTKDLATAHEIKKEVCMSDKGVMARSCEYFNKDIFEVTDRGGRLCIHVINWLGMGPIGPLWDVKRFVETLPIPFASILPDTSMYWLNSFFFNPLPAELQQRGKDYGHHMLMDFSEYNEGEVDALMGLLDQFVASKPEGDVKYMVCEGQVAAKVTLFRFVMAIAFRVFHTGKRLQGLSVDYALPKNFTTLPTLPTDKYPIIKRCAYAHFGCNVYHEDYIFGPDVDVEEAKHAIKHAIEEQGGKLPAEHGHGTEYPAPLNTKQRWMNMDPLNVMNPGVGHTAWTKNYARTTAGEPAGHTVLAANHA